MTEDLNDKATNDTKKSSIPSESENVKKTSPKLRKSHSLNPESSNKSSSPDSETQLEKIGTQKEDRGFATDLLKLPSFASTSSYFLNSAENIPLKTKKVDKLSASFKHRFVTKQFILDSLDEIIDIWYLNLFKFSKNIFIPFI